MIFSTANADLEERLFYRACPSPRFYTAKTRSVPLLQNFVAAQYGQREQPRPIMIDFKSGVRD